MLDRSKKDPDDRDEHEIAADVVRRSTSDEFRNSNMTSRKKPPPETAGEQAYEIGYVMFHCPDCGWSGKRWKSTRRCSKCRGLLVRNPGDKPHEEEEDDDGKNPHAVALGKLGGKKGGPARAKKLSAKRRKQIAKRAANARWAKKQNPDTEED